MDRLCRLQVILRDVIDLNQEPFPIYTATMKKMARDVGRLKKLLEEKPDTIRGRWGRIKDLDGAGAGGGLSDHIHKIIHDIKDNIDAADRGKRITSSLHEKLKTIRKDQLKPLLKYGYDVDTDYKVFLQEEELGELLVILNDAILKDMNPTSMMMMVELAQEVHTLKGFFVNAVDILAAFQEVGQQSPDGDGEIGDYIWSVCRDMQGILYSYLDQLAKKEGMVSIFSRVKFPEPKITSLDEQVRSLRQDKLRPLLSQLCGAEYSLEVDGTTYKIQKALGELQVFLVEAIERDLDPSSMALIKKLDEDVDRLKKLLEEEANIIMFRFGRISNLYYHAGLGDLEDHILKIVHHLKDTINSYFLIRPGDKGSRAISLNAKFSSFREKVEFITTNKLRPLLEDTEINGYPVTPSDLSANGSSIEQFSVHIKALTELKTILVGVTERDESTTSKAMMEEVGHDIEKLNRLLDERPDDITWPDGDTEEVELYIWTTVRDIQRIINIYIVQIPDDEGRYGIFTRTRSPNSKFPSLPRLVRYLRMDKMAFFLQGSLSLREDTADEEYPVKELGELQHILEETIETELPPICRVRMELMELAKEIEEFRGLFEKASQVIKLRCDNQDYETNLVHVDNLQYLQSNTRKLVHGIEDIMNTFLDSTAVDKGILDLFRRSIYPDLTSFVDQVKSTRLHKLKPLIEKANEFVLYEDSVSSNTGGGARDKMKEAPKKQGKVIGLKEVTDTVINLILIPGYEVDVISINGLPGVGKTALASEIYHHPEIEKLFRHGTTIWVNVGGKLINSKDVIITIWEKLHKQQHVASMPSDKALANIVKNYLKKTVNYLIILDNVSEKTWRKIEDVFPKGGMYCKVLLTTSNPFQASFLSRTPGIKLHCMDESRGWLLLYSQVYDNEDVECCPELERIGKFIVKQCAGLPRAILLIASILKRKVLSSSERNTAEAIKIWEEVAACVKDNLFDPDNPESMEDCMSMFYNKLTYSARNCLLYLAMFPAFTEIPKRKLVWFWGAEGLLGGPDKCSPVEWYGYDILKVLSSMDLIMITQGKDGRSSDTCYLNNLVHQFCTKKVASTPGMNMFHGIKRLAGGSHIQETEESCDHHLVMDKTKPQKVWATFQYCTTNKSVILENKHILQSVNAAFDMQRVLEANTVDILRSEAPKIHPLHLRHIILSDKKLNVVPRIISRFRNMQTLVVNTSSRTLEMEANLWELTQLQILQTNAAIILRKDRGGQGPQGGQNLVSLHYISPQSCSYLVTKKVRKLGIRGELAKLLDSTTFLEKLTSVRSLDLVNDVYPRSTSKNPLPRLPPSYLFPPKLHSLTLSSTYLNWKCTSTIAHLYYLNTLNLKNNAFVGDHWDVTESGNFHRLEHLSIERTNLKRWTAVTGSFPWLETLVLNKCEKLEGIPLEIGGCEYLQLLELINVSQTAVSSAKDIEKAIEEMRNRHIPLQLQVDTENTDLSTEGRLFSLVYTYSSDGSKKQATADNNPNTDVKNVW